MKHLARDLTGPLEPSLHNVLTLIATLVMLAVPAPAAAAAGTCMDGFAISVGDPDDSNARLADRNGDRTAGRLSGIDNDPGPRTVRVRGWSGTTTPLPSTESGGPRPRGCRRLLTDRGGDTRATRRCPADAEGESHDGGESGEQDSVFAAPGTHIAGLDTCVDRALGARSRWGPGRDRRRHRVPPGDSDAPTGITSGPDGNLWFTETSGNKIGRITPTGAVSEFATPTAFSVPTSIARGADGNLWFTETNGNKIGRITPRGEVTEFAIPTPSSAPTGIAGGPDGNLWFTETTGNKIGRVTPTGTFSEYGIPTPRSAPTAIARGPDGNVWFTESNGNKIGQITLAGLLGCDPPGGTIVEFAIPNLTSGLLGITSGSEGNLWFTETNGNKIGQITPTGVVSEFAIPTAVSAPTGITGGADGSLWFTETNGNKIGQIKPAKTVPANSWIAVASMPEPRAFPAASTGCDKRIYVIERDPGVVGDPNTTELVYSLVTGAWTTFAAMPTARAGIAAATGRDGRIYAFGGIADLIVRNTVEAYDPTTSAWTQVTPMPTARYDLAAALGSDGRIYAIGGFDADNGGLQNAVEAYTPATNTWTAVASMPTARAGLAAATGGDGRIYAIGGSNITGAFKGITLVEAYDPATDAWTTVAPMSTARELLAAAADTDGRIYAIGGRDTHIIFNTVEAYTPATNTWTTVAPMPTTRYSMAAVTGSDGSIYAIGGFNGFGLSMTEAYRP